MQPLSPPSQRDSYGTQSPEGKGTVQAPPPNKLPTSQPQAHLQPSGLDRLAEPALPWAPETHDRRKKGQWLSFNQEISNSEQVLASMWMLGEKNKTHSSQPTQHLAWSGEGTGRRPPTSIASLNSSSGSASSASSTLPGVRS